jgi:cytochrome c553
LLRLPLGLLAGVAVLGAVVLFVAAPLNIAARIGPYPGIGWALHTYMKQWARNWSFFVTKPDFVDLAGPALIRLGAGYFESGCAACHSAPGRDRNPLVTMMEPPPPPLASKEVANFSDAELYWIVWNGVRYTAMPGWSGDHREDEVWAMVAFLRTYQKLTPQEYVRLANGDVHPTGGDHAGAIGFDDVASHMDKTLQTCARCHGADGMGRDGTAPKIAGQSRQYLTATLAGYAAGRRSSGIMQPIAAPLSQNEIAALAAHFSAMPSSVGRTAPSSPTTIPRMVAYHSNPFRARPFLVRSTLWAWR